jgi:protein involved in polysaccharide export with SLBB domain
MRVLKFLVCFIVLVSTLNCSEAQDLLKAQNLSSVKIDALTDDQIAQFKQQLAQSGLSESQAEQLALQRGLPMAEISKLRARLANTGATNTANKSVLPAKNNFSRTVDSTTISSYTINTKQSRVFGSELFNNPTPMFEPNLRLATPKNYVLGPDDELAVDIFGYQEANYRLQISPEGSVNIPYIGIVPVVGLTIEQATKRIKDKMTKNGYASLANGNTQLQVSVGKIRNIKVTIIGMAVKPGSYSIPSLSTVFNALYAAGGITENGSFRQIELIRNNKLLLKLDAYDFLLKGDQSKNVRLEDQDVIRIPPVQTQVAISGEVKKEGLFEMLSNNNLQQLLEYAGGFTNNAYTAAVQINEIAGIQRSIKDVAESQYKNFVLKRGDSVIVEKVLDKLNNSVTISGAVYKPGIYEYSNGITLTQLIQKAAGLKEEAFKERGLIVRRNDSTFTKQSISFNLGDILQNKAQNIVLKNYDEVIIGSKDSLKKTYSITIEGEVKNPGVYPYFEGVLLSDIIFLANGFTDASASNKIEISRRTSVEDTSATIAKVIEAATAENLQYSNNGIQLQPWDVIAVRKKANYQAQISVQINGEVKYPGKYVLVEKNERVSSLIKRAGGTTVDAFTDAASLVRLNNAYNKEVANEQIKRIQKSTKDSSNALLENAEKSTIKVGLNLPYILNNPNSLEDVVLQEGDVLVMPKQKNEVKVSGQVMLPSEVVYNKDYGLKDYITKAGGYTESARYSRTYVLYPNGSASRVKRFLFFKNYPAIKPGSEILVPAMLERSGKGLSTAEIVGLTSAVASLAGVVIAILR